MNPDCTILLLEAIQHKDTTLTQLGKLYAESALSECDVDWKIVHQAIMDRWTVNGMMKVQLIATGQSMMEGLKVWR